MMPFLQQLSERWLKTKRKRRSERWGEDYQKACRDIFIIHEVILARHKLVLPHVVKVENIAWKRDFRQLKHLA
jgi:hypothetical protein